MQASVIGQSIKAAETDRRSKSGRQAGALSLLAIILAATLALLASASPSDAASRVCRQLLSQANDHSDARSVRSLRRELARTLSQADRRGCFGGFFFRARSNRCGALLSRVDRLERMISQPAPRTARNKDWIKRELVRNKCLDDKSVGTQEAALAQPRDPASEGYRTACVRQCDGYFFPLGFSRSKSEFARDRETCKALYGRSTADLYFYPSGSSPDQMISVEGEAYKAKSFAFAYQRAFVPACQAQLQHGIQEQQDRFSLATARDAFRQFKLMPIPVPRPSGDEPAPRDAVDVAPKSVSRIIASVPFYATDSSSVGIQDEVSKPKETSGSNILAAILDWVSPPAKAESQ
jgi:hypothetical protein